MSASREKRTRQNDPSLTEKQRQAKQHTAAAQQKARLYTVIGVVAAIAVAALLIWDSGLFRKDSTAMVINGREYSAGEVSYYYSLARQQYSYYLQYMGYDTSLSDRSQFVDEASGQTYYDMFLADAKTNMVQVAALADAARAEGMTLDEASQADVESAIKLYSNYAVQYGYNLSSYLKANFGEFMTEKLLRSCMEEEALARQYYTAYTDSLSYDDADLKAYYEEHAATLDSYRYDICFVSGALTGEDVTDEAKQAAKDQAKADAEALLEAEDFAVQANLVANKNDASYFTEDTTTVGSSVSTLYRDWLADASRVEGDRTLVETESSGYYVIRYVDRFLNEASLGNVDIRHILIKAEVAEGETEPSEEALAAAKETAQSVLDTFLAGEQTGEAFGALAAEYSEDPGSSANGGLYTDVTRSTNFFTAFLNWIFQDGRAVGDTGLVENPQSGQQGWHIMYLDKVNRTQWEETAYNALLSDATNAWIEDLQSGYEAVEANGIKLIG